jgi:excisionase family DNA binding protein
MNAHTPDTEALLTPAEVATMFRVDPKTVTRWAKAGKLTSIRTLGGHRRFPRAGPGLWERVNVRGWLCVLW